MSAGRPAVSVKQTIFQALGAQAMPRCDVAATQIRNGFGVSPMQMDARHVLADTI